MGRGVHLERKGESLKGLDRREGVWEDTLTSRNRLGAQKASGTSPKKGGERQK